MNDRIYALIVTLAVMAAVTALLAMRIVQGEQAGALIGVYAAALLYWARSPTEGAPKP